jgi:hypothetical protein
VEAECQEDSPHRQSELALSEAEGSLSRGARLHGSPITTGWALSFQALLSKTAFSLGGGGTGCSRSGVF